MNETIVQLNFETAGKKGHTDIDRDCVSYGVTAGCLWITCRLPLLQFTANVHTRSVEL
jgi:hypothetical protein